jgi:putative tryptophan/tyrosine transport system substrate-binding protein
MRRRQFIALLGGAATTWPLAARAQEAGRTYRLGVLFPAPREEETAIAAFSDELRRRGFIEDQNLAIEYRAWAPHLDLISDYITELLKSHPDVIAAGGPQAVRAAQQATKTISILAITDDMVGEGLVSSMARPNGNTTGVSILATELDGKRQEVLTEAIPGLRRIAVLADFNSTAVEQLNELQNAARARNTELSIHRIAKGEEIPAAIEAAKSLGDTAINVLASPMLYSNRQIIFQQVAALHLPAIYQFAEMAEEGGLLAYGPRFSQIMRDIYTRQLVQLFRGAKVTDIPVEQPTKFELVINLRTAKTLGLNITESFLQRADKVIE